MFSHLSAQVLLVVHTVTSYGEWRPRDCTRVFYFDFEKHRGLEEGAGGIWQGQEGDVLFQGGKAWLDGNGSLIYPFFSNNDLRPSFALSFKVKPARLRTHGRVAIITNGLAPGSSTLTVFHNESSLGVKVVETEEPPPWAREAESSRKVELIVDYTKYKQRGKRSLESNDANGSQTTGSPASSVNTGSGKGASGGEEPGEGDSFSNLGQEEGQREDNAGTSYEAALSEALIAVRRLFRQDGTVHKPKSGTKTTTRRTPTTTTTTTSTTELPMTTQIDIEESESNDQHVDKDSQGESVNNTHVTSPATTASIKVTKDHDESENNDQHFDKDITNNTHTTTPTTTAASRVTLRNIIVRPGFIMPTSRYELYREQTTMFPRSTIPASTTSASSTTPSVTSSTAKSVPTTNLVEKSTQGSVVKPTPESVVKSVLGSETLPVQQTTPRPDLRPVVVGRLNTAFIRYPPPPPSRIKALPVERPATISSRGNDRFLYVPDIFKGMEDENPEEIEVRLAQDNGVLSLQVGNSAVQKTHVGSMEHMKAPHSALRVGAGDGLRPYRGSFDEFMMYDCAPHNFFKDKGSRIHVWTRKNS